MEAYRSVVDPAARVRPREPSSMRQARPQRGRGGFDPIRHAELSDDVGHVDARGALADEKGLGDAPVGLALDEQGEYLPLASRKPVRIGDVPGRARDPPAPTSSGDTGSTGDGNSNRAMRARFRMASTSSPAPISSASRNASPRTSPTSGRGARDASIASACRYRHHANSYGRRGTRRRFAALIQASGSGRSTSRVPSASASAQFTRASPNTGLTPSS